jgi:hypothetical protein
MQEGETPMSIRSKAAVVLASIGMLVVGGATASGEITQNGNLTVAVEGKLRPSSLPREGVAPVRVSVASKIHTTDETQPPRLRQLRIEINRHGQLETTGLPVCTAGRIQTATSGRALSACRKALVGQGSFEAEVSLASQEPYAAKAKLLVFNSISGGKPVLLGHVYSARPFTTSFLIVFKISEQNHGTFGTTLNAILPRTLGSWGVVTGIRMNLSRRYGADGKRRSFLSAGCPAPKGVPKVAFPLARTKFRFAGGQSVESTVTRTCQAK